MIVTKSTGLARFYHATRYSIKGIKAAYASEPAFRYEVWMAAPMFPLAFFVSQSGLQLGLLISTLLVVLMMELLNTAIEAIVDRAGTEFHQLAGLAKDLGSAAVLLSLFITLAVWGGVIWDNFLA
ncbi:Diacylglycerol kinase [Marinobacterium lacunae]|uniref:Diacylglycerol kinase n=1 Tax=Marinobacterium lacunae TaxID=1232683 RepID=A0A081FW11_9GAMM|nr:diacylglycerol kinase [Marinobacterium lacunae]KEA62716.1 Diacylglycerol kinase [Marinobacterium lacunae]MBR9885768.1 diacylglycerol kinase [Oceanospirillales bacterium]